MLVAFSWPSSVYKDSVCAFFVASSWLGQILHVLALEKSSKSGSMGVLGVWTHVFFLGEGKWGSAKYRRISKCEAAWRGRFPNLEDRNPLKLRSLDSSCPFSLNDNSI